MKSLVHSNQKGTVFLKRGHTEYGRSTDGVPSKSQNLTVSGQGGSPNVQTLAGCVIGTIHLAPTTTLHFNTVLKGIHSCIGFFSFFDKISLEI